MYTHIAPHPDVYHSVQPTRLPPKKKGQRWTESEDENLRNGEEKFRDVGKSKWRRVSEEIFYGQRKPEMCRRRFVNLQKESADKDSEQKEIEELYRAITEKEARIVEVERAAEDIRTRQREKPKTRREQ